MYIVAWKPNLTASMIVASLFKVTQFCYKAKEERGEAGLIKIALRKVKF